MNVLPDELPLVHSTLSALGVLKRRDEWSADYSESAFDTLIVEQAVSIASTFRSAGLIEPSLKLRVIGQQIANVDVMMAEVDADDLVTRLVLFETKLFKNPESNRKVLAQIFEYASRDWSVDELLKASFGETRKWLAEQRDSLEAVVSNGDFLLVIAGDRIQPRLVDIAKPMLDRHTFKGVELALLSLAVYEGSGTTVVVPNLVGAVTGRQRELRIKVTVQMADGTVVPATAQLENSSEPEQARQLWTEESFLEAVRSGPYPDLQPGMSALLQFLSSTPRLIARWTKTITPMFNIDVECPDGHVRVLWVGGEGSSSIWRDTLIKRMGEARANRWVDELAKKLGVPIKLGAQPYIGDSTNYFDVRKVAHQTILFDWLKRLSTELQPE